MSNNPLKLHAIDWFNFMGDFPVIFNGVRNHHLVTDRECAVATPEDPDRNKITFRDLGQHVEVLRDNPHFPNGSTVSKFMLLCAVKFKHDKSQCISFIEFEMMGEAIPYIRVKCDYYKVISKEDRYTGVQTNLISWKKDEIKQDHSKTLLQSIPKFDDFTIEPNNKDHKSIIRNCYNLYSKFPHTPYEGNVELSDIPVTINLIEHVFGGSEGRREQLQQALIYLKTLYEFPKQILPILCLVSKARNTGKTTVLNWLDMIFGNNFILVAPEDLTDKFNGDFATKNIIAADETFIEKNHGVEKVKSLATAKKINISEKFISKYSIPFYGKIILCTNKVKDFMRIDEEEIRFWIRKLPAIKGKKNTKIEEQLFNEIPKFLKFLSDLPPINFDNGERMVLSKQDIETEELLDIKAESKSELYKRIEMKLIEFFDNNPVLTSFCASAIDIEEEWFHKDNKISAPYIRKVLQEEFGMQSKRSHDGKSIKYYRFGRDQGGSFSSDYKTGTPFEFFC